HLRLPYRPPRTLLADGELARLVPSNQHGHGHAKCQDQDRNRNAVAQQRDHAEYERRGENDGAATQPGHASEYNAPEPEPVQPKGLVQIPEERGDALAAADAHRHDAPLRLPTP